MKKKEVVSQPLIGKTICIVTSKNKTLGKIQGVVEDETAQTITISGKKIQKNAVIVEVDGYTINGSELIGTYTRIKKG